MPTKETVDILFDVYRESQSARVRREGNTGRAEVEVVVFGKGGPIACDDPLDTAADGPSRWIRARVCGSGASDVGERGLERRQARICAVGDQAIKPLMVDNDGDDGGAAETGG